MAQCNLNVTVTNQGENVSINTNIDIAGLQTPPTITNDGTTLFVTYDFVQGGPVNDIVITPLLGCIEIEVEVNASGTCGGCKKRVIG